MVSQKCHLVQFRLDTNTLCTWLETPNMEICSLLQGSCCFMKGSFNSDDVAMVNPNTVQYSPRFIFGSICSFRRILGFVPSMNERIGNLIRSQRFPGGQGLRLYTPNAGGLGSIPGQGSRSHMPQLRAHMPKLKILHATMKFKDPECHN